MIRRWRMICILLAVTCMVAAQQKRIPTRVKTWQMPSFSAVADTITFSDTAMLNYHDIDLQQRYTMSSTMNGNVLVSPIASRIIQDRSQAIEDPFAWCWSPYVVTPQQQRYFNTTTPFSSVAYKKGFVSGHEENDINFLFTGNIGKPLNVTEEVAKHADLERPELILHLLEVLTHRMQSLILWVPNDKDYEQNIHALQANPPAPLNAFVKHKMSKYLLGAMLLVLLPLFLCSAVITFPLWSVWLLIRKVIKDKAFHNSVQFVWQLVFVTLTLWTTLPFWMFFQEYLYLFRKLKKIVQP